MKVKNMAIKFQRGMVLIVALIMVVLMSVVAIASIKGSGLQEAMSGSMRDRNVALQSAESALRNAEAKVADLSFAIGPAAAANDNGYFIDLNKNTTISRPIDWTASDWAANALQLSGIKDVYSQPYVVSEMLSYSGSVLNAGGGVDFISQDRTTEYQFYRVTARSVGLTENTEIILQSTYVR